MIGVPAASALEHGVSDMQDIVAVCMQLPASLSVHGQVDSDVEGIPRGHHFGI